MKRLLLLFALAGCTEASAPEDRLAKAMAEISGDWRAVSVAGKPMPFLVATGDQFQRTEILAATLSFYHDGTWVREATFRETNKAGASAIDVRYLVGQLSGSLETGPLSIRFRVNQQNVIVWTGTFRGDSLVISGFAETWVYRR